MPFHWAGNNARSFQDGGFRKFDPDLLIVFRCNFWSILHRFRVLGHFKWAGNDVIAFSAARGRLEASKMADSDSLNPTY